jgi:putative ABC transport system permease protein
MVRSGKMRNPLSKRVLRGLKEDPGKYTALFIFLALTIGLISGFLVADGSLQRAYNDSFEKYKVEDGHFTLAVKAAPSLIKAVEDKGVKVTPLFYKDKKTPGGHTIRLFRKRTRINKLCLMGGKLPSGSDEIALDRLYAENNSLKIGDKIKISGKSYRIRGTVALSDYSALFKNNTDMMFDANKFSVAIVSGKAFNALGSGGLHYCYAWRNSPHTSARESSHRGDQIRKVLAKTGMLTDFVKAQDNNAITFTGDDMGGDKTMMLVLLYLVIAVMAFIFAATTRSRIEQEARVVGTLRASGYQRMEILTHYLMLPLLVTFTAAVAGNILGYGPLKQLIVNLYYHSYSLPTYETVWSSEAFWKTTAVPCVIMLAVNIIVLMKALSLPPLQFLRLELHKKKRKKVARLGALSFIARVRARIIGQNMTAYITLAIGIALSSILLMFGLVMSPLLSDFKADVQHSRIANYQYILKAPVATAEKAAEKYAVSSLTGVDNEEEITVYGVSEHSRYLKDLDVSSLHGSQVIASDGYMEKFDLHVGDKIKLEKKLDNEQHTFTIAGRYHFPAALSIFMSRGRYNHIFDKEDTWFNGYFSNRKIHDVNEEYIASTITEADLTVAADQLDDSMGRMFSMITAFSIILYIMMMYLLSKIIIDRNSNYISLIKILGYTDEEANRLYNAATAIVVIVSLVVSLPVASVAMRQLFYIFMAKMNGWMPFKVPWFVYLQMLAFGIISYAIVHWIQTNRIRKISVSFKEAGLL